MAALALGVVAPAPAFAEARPDLAQSLAFTGFVVDQAHVLTAAQAARLTRRLDRFQQATGHQLAVVTVTSLAGEDVGRFTTRLANRWDVGRRGLDDGMVLLVAPIDRKARIAIGYGLARQVPDALCARIMRERMIPNFARGRIADGIDAATSALIAAASGRAHLVKPPG